MVVLQRPKLPPETTSAAASAATTPAPTSDERKPTNAAAERRPSEQESIMKEYDAAMAEILLKRAQQPPDLNYLGMEHAGSLQSRTYTYSSEMVKAIGVSANRIPKGRSNYGCHADGGAPWESVPLKLRDPLVSVAGADYVARPPMPELPEDFDSAGTGDLLKKIHREKEFRERRQQHTQKLLAELEADRQRERQEQEAKDAAEREMLGALQSTVKCFNHGGMSRRAISAPLPGDSDEEDQVLVQRRRMAVVRQDKPIAGTMGLRIPILPKRSYHRGSATPDPSPDGDGQDGDGDGDGDNGGSSPPRCESTVDVDIHIGQRAAQRPSAFWYAKDRQRMKHRTLEEMRLAEAQEALLKQGWAQSTDMGGRPKRVGGGNVLAGVPQEQQERIEQQAQEFFAAKQRRDEEARTRYNSMIARARPSELRGTVPVLSSPFAHEEVAPLREQVSEHSRTAVDVAGAAAAEGPEGHQMGRVYVRPFMFERPPPFKPLPVYRPELPAARVPEVIEKLEMPIDAETAALRARKGAAPPWGRESAEDEKWARIHVNRANKTVEVKPLTKKEITQELRMVRDKGLMKKPRRNVGAGLTEAQREFIKSIPSTGPMVAQAMAPAAKPASGSLR